MRNIQWGANQHLPDRYTFEKSLLSLSILKLVVEPNAK